MRKASAVSTAGKITISSGWLNSLDWVSLFSDTQESVSALYELAAYISMVADLFFWFDASISL